CLSLALSSRSALRRTFASSPELINFFSLRAVSRAFNTSPRTFPSNSQSLPLSAGRPLCRSASRGNNVMWTLSGLPVALGKYFQSSSAVKTRIGAARRTSALVIFHTAVCAERRDLLLGDLV